MEEEYYADRAILRQLRAQHPNWPVSQFMAATKRSRSWVKKWLKRFAAAAPDDEAVLHGQSHTPKHLPAPLSQQVVQRILEIRDHPPAHLQRVPGPKAIQYFLQQDERLHIQGKAVCPSTRSIWRVLVAHGRIVHTKPPQHEPVERPAPMSAWELDFKDVTSVRSEVPTKHAPALQCLNAVDKGTSILVDFRLHSAFNAQTTLEAVVELFREHGLPHSVTLDRDVRFVGSSAARDFPSAMMRLLLCLGVQVIICPPQSPQEKPFVERYHGTYDRECLKRHRPSDQAQAQAVTEQFMRHYNFERPHQGLACGNRPPRVAFPELPILRALPSVVDPDAWLQQVAGRPYTRRINQNGTIKIDGHIYYIQRALAGQYVLVKVDAQTGEFVVELRHHVIKRLPIRGLQRRFLPFQVYLEMMIAQAYSEWRRYMARAVLRKPLLA